MAFNTVQPAGVVSIIKRPMTDQEQAQGLAINRARRHRRLKPAVCAAAAAAAAPGFPVSAGEPV